VGNRQRVDGKRNQRLASIARSHGRGELNGKKGRCIGKARRLMVAGGILGPLGRDETQYKEACFTVELIGSFSFSFSSWEKVGRTVVIIVMTVMI
jgi:hypothetical protein